jgi:hypothetical protein
MTEHDLMYIEGMLSCLGELHPEVDPQTGFLANVRVTGSSLRASHLTMLLTYDVPNLIAEVRKPRGGDNDRSK